MGISEGEDKKEEEVSDMAGMKGEAGERDEELLKEEGMRRK